MSSWQYADAVPTFPWKGQMAIPRNISLRQMEDGLRLFQEPISTLKPKKDYLVFEKNNFAFSKEKQLDGMTLFAKNSYMVEIEFKRKSAQIFGLRIAQLKDKKDDKKILQQTTIGYDVQTHQLYIDRKNSGVMIKENFASLDKTTLKLKDKTLKLKVLVDKSSVEVFANDGEKVISDLIFPTEGANMFSLFTSRRKVKVVSLKISDLSK
jgi:levanase/fructan beta-fructosidase